MVALEPVDAQGNVDFLAAKERREVRTIPMASVGRRESVVILALEEPQGM